MIVSAIWFGLFALPVLFTVPEYRARRRRARAGRASSQSTRRLGRDIARSGASHRPTVWFLLASAVYRDGLAGVFAFGGVLAASRLRLLGRRGHHLRHRAEPRRGRLDDRGRRARRPVRRQAGHHRRADRSRSCAGCSSSSSATAGRSSSGSRGSSSRLFVGPAQSASPTFLARITPPGREGEIFGLYATTGRAVSFLAPTMFALFVTIGGATYFGILGIVLVLVIGLVLLIPVKAPSTGSACATDRSGRPGESRLPSLRGSLPTRCEREAQPPVTMPLADAPTCARHRRALAYWGVMLALYAVAVLGAPPGAAGRGCTSPPLFVHLGSVIVGLGAAVVPGVPRSALDDRRRTLDDAPPRSERSCRRWRGSASSACSPAARSCSRTSSDPLTVVKMTAVLVVAMNGVAMTRLTAELRRLPPGVRFSALPAPCSCGACGAPWSRRSAGGPPSSSGC